MKKTWPKLGGASGSNSNIIFFQKKRDDDDLHANAWSLPKWTPIITMLPAAEVKALKPIYDMVVLGSHIMA